MDKFEEYFRTTKHYQNMLLDIARNQLSVSVFDKNDRKYRNHIVQISYEVFQHQQAKVEELEHKIKCERETSLFADKLCCELQKRVDKAIRLLVEAELYQSEPNIDLAVKALKGEDSE